MVLRPLFKKLLGPILKPIFAAPIPITQMDLVSNLILQRGVGPATFTRPTIGRFDDVSTELNTTAAIDIARFEINGLLMEGASTNLLLHSEEFDNPEWTKASSAGPSTPVITANQIISPAGDLTADKVDLSAVSGSNQFAIIHQKPAQATNIHNASVYLHGDTGGETLWLMTTPDGNTYTQVQTTLITSWQRFNINTEGLAADSFVQIGIDLRDVAQSAQSAQNIFDWGAQLEPLPFASSYIKTTTTAVPRAKDTLSYDAVNIPPPTENYTISMEADILGLDSTKTQTVYNVDGETSRKIEINTITGLVEATHGAVTSTSTTALVPGVKVKIAFAVGDTNQTLYINGVQEDQDVKGTVTGTATALAICNAAGLNQLFGHSKFNKIFAKELTPDEVARL